MQTLSLKLGIAAFLVATIFPPWKVIYSDEKSSLQKMIGHELLFPPPDQELFAVNALLVEVHIDFDRLILNWVIVIVTTLGAMVMFYKPSDGVSARKEEDYAADR